MKEAIGGVSLFQIVIVFLLLFTGIMCLTINHSKAFGVKDEIINILENEGNAASNGLSDEVVEKIVGSLNEVGYRITGECPDEEGWVGYTRNIGQTNNDKAAFCIKGVSVSDAYESDLNNACSGITPCNITSGNFPNMMYYDVIVFYQLDIPIIKNITNFKISGSTKILYGEL